MSKSLSILLYKYCTSTVQVLYCIVLYTASRTLICQCHVMLLHNPHNAITTSRIYMSRSYIPVDTTGEVVEYVIAEYDYGGEADGDLSFQKGDKIVVTEKISADWLKGELRGRQGMFPRAFAGEIVRETKSSTSSNTQGTVIVLLNRVLASCFVFVFRSWMWRILSGLDTATNIVALATKTSLAVEKLRLDLTQTSPPGGRCDCSFLPQFRALLLFGCVGIGCRAWSLMCPIRHQPIRWTFTLSVLSWTIHQTPLTLKSLRRVQKITHKCLEL